MVSISFSQVNYKGKHVSECSRPFFSLYSFVFAKPNSEGRRGTPCCQLVCLVCCHRLSSRRFLDKTSNSTKSSHKENSKQNNHNHFCTTKLLLKHLRSEMHLILTKARKDAQGVVLAFFLTNRFRSLSPKFVLWDAESSFEVVFKSFS